MALHLAADVAGQTLTQNLALGAGVTIDGLDPGTHDHSGGVNGPNIPAGSIVDGPGSGLDADTVDGQEATALLARANHTGTQAPATISPQGAASGLDADTVDGNEATALLDRTNHTGTQAPATISPQGGGSGLDADTLDGLEGSAYATVGQSNTFTQQNFFRGATSFRYIDGTGGGDMGVVGSGDNRVLLNNSNEGFVFDLGNERLGINLLSFLPQYTIDANGDANVSGVYRVGGTQISSADLSNDAALEKTANKNVANGYAGLDGSSKLTASQMQEVIDLADLLDVSATAPTDGQVLAWNNGLSTWEPQTAASGVSGTVGRIAKFDTASSVADSAISETGTFVISDKMVSVEASSAFGLGEEESIATGSTGVWSEIKGSTAYVLSSNSFRIYDATDTTSLNLVGNVGLTNSKHMAVAGSRAIVYDASTVKVYDISNPNSPSLTNSLAAGTNGTFGFLVGCVYYTCGNDDHKLHIIDVTDPDNLVESGFIDYGSSPDLRPLEMWARGDKLFVVVSNVTSGDYRLYIYDNTDPFNPVELDNTEYANSQWQKLDANDRYVFIANTKTGFLGIDVIDYQVPTAPTRTTTAISAGTAKFQSVRLAGNRLYVGGDSRNGGDFSAAKAAVWVYDITNPLSPTLLSGPNEFGQTRGVDAVLGIPSGQLLPMGSNNLDGNETFAIARVPGMVSGSVKTGFASAEYLAVANQLDTNRAYVQGLLNVGPGGIATTGGLCVNDHVHLGSVVNVRRSAAAGSQQSAENAVVFGVTGTTGGTVTIDSDDIAEEGRIFIVKDEGGNAGTNNITVATEGAETIDGAASLTISTNYGVARLYSDGSNLFTW